MNKLRLTAGAAAAAAALITGFEGLRLNAYLDPVKIPTICYGTTKGVKMGDKATLEQCQALLREDMQIAAATVASCVTVPLSDYEMAAYTSFAYNVGPGKKGVKDGFCTLRSGNTPSFLRKLNAGDRAGACAGLSDWTGARNGGTVITYNGLIKRRAAERSVCEGKGLPA